VTATDLLLRPAVPDDLPAVARLYLSARRAAAEAGAMPRLVHSEEAVETHVVGLDLADPARREIWLAEGESGLLGWAQVAGDWLDGLYVDPAAQRRGVGATLLDVAKSLRPQGFGLWVFACNRPARSFYARHGLEELEQTDGSANEEGEPDIRMVWPGVEPLVRLRGMIDEVDDELAGLLARRVALTAAVQRHKPVGGPSGRDPEREREIARRVAGAVPVLGPDRVQRIVHSIITESLEALEER
jgi:chorismate mutase/GNAT superfamily N-acetyltransferase